MVLGQKGTVVLGRAPPCLFGRAPPCLLPPQPAHCAFYHLNPATRSLADRVAGRVPDHQARSVQDRAVDGAQREEVPLILPLGDHVRPAHEAEEVRKALVAPLEGLSAQGVGVALAGQEQTCCMTAEREL